MQQHLRHDHRGEEADGDTDPQREREPLDGAGTELEEDRGSEHRRQVRVEDRRERALATLLDGDAQRFAGAQLFLEPLEREHVGIDGHTDREDESGDAGERERHWDEAEDRVGQRRVKGQRHDGEDSRHAVVGDHEEGHEQESHRAGDKAPVYRLRAECRLDSRRLNHRERNR